MSVGRYRLDEFKSQKSDISLLKNYKLRHHHDDPYKISSGRFKWNLNHK